MENSRSKKTVAASLSLVLALGSVPAVALADQDINENTNDIVEQEAGTAYDVYYMANGGEFASGEDYLQGVTNSNGIMSQPSAPTRDGYTFKGWYWCSSQEGMTDEQLELNKVDFSQPIENNATIYALWDKEAVEASYDVLYVANGGQFMTGEDTMQGLTDSDGFMRQPPAPTRDGYTFGGWYWHADLSGYTDEQKAADKVDFNQAISSSAVVYAQWVENKEQADEYNVLYVANGGQFVTGETYQQGVTDSDGIMRQPAAPTREGYTFEGWYWHADLSGYTDEQKAADKVDFAEPVQSNVTIYAQWKAETPVEKVTVTFVDNFNKTESKVEVNKGETVAKPADPSCEGYEFTGWSSTFEDADGNPLYTPVDFSKAIEEDATYYAFYTEVKPAVDPDDEKADEPEQKEDATDNKATGEKKADEKASESPKTADETDVATVAGVGGFAGLIAAAAAMLRRRNNN